MVYAGTYVRDRHKLFQGDGDTGAKSRKNHVHVDGIILGSKVRTVSVPGDVYPTNSNITIFGVALKLAHKQKI